MRQTVSHSLILLYKHVKPQKKNIQAMAIFLLKLLQKVQNPLQNLSYSEKRFLSQFFFANKYLNEVIHINSSTSSSTIT